MEGRGGGEAQGAADPKRHTSVGIGRSYTAHDFDQKKMALILSPENEAATFSLKLIRKLFCKLKGFRLILDFFLKLIL
jgi:hypothetical protein